MLYLLAQSKSQSSQLRLYLFVDFEWGLYSGRVLETALPSTIMKFITAAVILACAVLALPPAAHSAPQFSDSRGQNVPYADQWPGPGQELIPAQQESRNENAELQRVSVNCPADPFLGWSLSLAFGWTGNVEVYCDRSCTFVAVEAAGVRVYVNVGYEGG